MSQDSALYAAKGVWDQPLQIGQANLLRALCDFWPEGIGSALDVGCGDGKLTARLADYAKQTTFVGLDGSVEALARLPFSSVKGDAQSLPFADAAFDLVMSTDMLEHLDDAQENRAWSELFRVGAKTVMVAVPFREDLQEAQTRCRDCGHVYHVNWHQRHYDIADLHRRAPAGWQVQTTVLSGEPWSQQLPPDTHVRRVLLGEDAGWTLSVCPQCGAQGHAPDPQRSLPPLLAQALASMVYPALQQRRWHRSHSEILVIFQRDGYQSEMPVPTAPVTYAQPATRIDFSRQPADPNFAPFCQTAQYVISADDQLRLQFPLYEGAPVLEASRQPGAKGKLHLLLEDAHGVLFDDDILGADQDHATLTLSRAPVAGHYGIVATCAAHVFGSIQLGAGPNVERLMPPAPQTPGYWRGQYANKPLWVQVSAPLWLDAGTLTDEPTRELPRQDQVLARVEDCFKFSRKRVATQLNALSVTIQNLGVEGDLLRPQRDEALAQRDEALAQRDEALAQRDEALARIEYKLGARARRILKKLAKRNG